MTDITDAVLADLCRLTIDLTRSVHATSQYSDRHHCCLSTFPTAVYSATLLLCSSSQPHPPLDNESPCYR